MDNRDQKAVDTSGFKIDEYEQNAYVLEKYVANMDVMQPKGSKDLKGEVLSFVQKYHNGQTSLLSMFGVLKAVRDWGADGEQRAQNEQLYQVQSKLAQLATRKTELNRKAHKIESMLISMIAHYQDLLTDSDGIQTTEELEERISDLKLTIKENL